MLHYEALRPDTLDVVKMLMAEPLLGDFMLVGGTALALYYGHRLSEDVDLFVSERFDIEQILAQLGARLQFNIKVKNPTGAHIFIKEVKVDLVYFPYKPIRPVNNFNGIRCLSIEDIAAMKLNAIANRGARKDFYDIYFLLKQYSLSEQIGFFREKFSTHDIFGVQRSLGFFADADTEAEIRLIAEPDLTWEKVKRTISQENKKLL